MISPAVLDLTTVAVLTTLVVTVSAVLFLAETVLRRDEGAGRIWALGFVSGMLTSVSYLFWALMPGQWWPIAIGAAMFVMGTGSMWLGARRFNDRTMPWAWLVVGGAAGGAFLSAAAEGPDGGDWAGALWMFVALLLLAAAGSVECFRGAMGRYPTAWGLGIVLAVQALYYAGRIIAFIVDGPDGEVFTRWFGAIPTGVLTVVLTIVGVVVTSVLRAGRARLRGYAAEANAFTEGILGAADTRSLLAGACAQAAERGEVLAVTAVRIDDLEQIASAFGMDAATAVVAGWRRSVRRGAPTLAVVGEDDLQGLVIVSAVTGRDEARRRAARAYRDLIDDLGALGHAVIPVVGVGLALTSDHGYDAEALMVAARDAARRAATRVETSVQVA